MALPVILQGNSLNAPVILEVAKAIGAHLELSDVLGALHTTLKPMVEFDAIGVVVRDGDYAKLHSLYIQGFQREGHESVQSMLERKASDLKLEPLSARVPLNDHYLSAVMKSLSPTYARTSKPTEISQRRRLSEVRHTELRCPATNETR